MSLDTKGGIEPTNVKQESWPPTDPQTMRALSHPLRVSLIELLRREGSLSATQAATRLGASQASCSFHLRQLAKFGFVQEVEGVRGRARPYRLSARGAPLGRRPATIGTGDLPDEPHLEEIAKALPAQLAELASLFLRQAAALSRTDVRVMQRLSREPQRITQLAAEEQIKQPSMTLLVNRLEERRWVTREPDPSDGRAVLVWLTPAGHAALHSLQTEYHEMLAVHMATLDDGELRSLAQAVRVLDDLVTRLKAGSPD